MSLSSEPFEAIETKKKVIESRLYDDKRKKIEIGDEIHFSQSDGGEKLLKAKVIGLLRYDLFENMFSDIDPALFGGESSDFLLNQIHSFYSEEQEKEHGVLGIRLQLIA